MMHPTPSFQAPLELHDTNAIQAAGLELSLICLCIPSRLLPRYSSKPALPCVLPITRASHTPPPDTKKKLMTLSPSLKLVLLLLLPATRRSGGSPFDGARGDMGAGLRWLCRSPGGRQAAVVKMTAGIWVCNHDLTTAAELEKPSLLISSSTLRE